MSTLWRRLASLVNFLRRQEKKSFYQCALYFEMWLHILKAVNVRLIQGRDEMQPQKRVFCEGLLCGFLIQKGFSSLNLDIRW